MLGNIKCTFGIEFQRSSAAEEPSSGGTRKKASALGEVFSSLVLLCFFQSGSVVTRMKVFPLRPLKQKCDAASSAASSQFKNVARNPDIY